MRREPIYFAILIFLILLEIGCHSMWQFVTKPFILSILYFIIGILIPLITWFIVAHHKHAPSVRKNLKQVSPSSAILCIILITLGLWHYASVHLSDVPIDYRMADMIPVIQTMARRFLVGDEIYAPIPEIWNGIQPIYLPALWMPFSLSELLNVDPRWIPVSGITLASASLIWKSRQHPFGFIGTVLCLICTITTLTILDQAFITLTQEGVIIFYYVFLAVALLQRNVFLIAMAVMLCLLSRFYLIGWLLCLSLGILFFQSKRDVVRFGTTGLLLGILFLWVSGAINQLELFLNLPAHYVHAVLNDYEKFSPTIQSNLGLAKFFSFSDLGVMNQLNTSIAFILPFLLLALYYKSKVRPDLYHYFLIGLKLCLVFIFNLMIIPYSYLFYTSTFMSIALIPLLFERSNSTQTMTDAEVK